MDLLSIVLTLRPAPGQPSANGEPAPFWWGRAAQNLFLSTLQRDDPALAARLHDEQGPHPYTVSTLLGRFPNQQIDPSASYTLRLTAFEPALAARLHALTRPGASLGSGARVELDRRPFTVEQAAERPAEQPWAGQAGYAELAAACLSQPQPARRIALHWASPVTFRSGGRDLPLPLPELVFGSLLDRWNSFSPVALPEEARRYAAECLAISRYELKTRSAPLKDGAQRVGATGQVSFVTFNYDRYWMSALHALAAFSLYSGLGAGTAHGMGQCRAADPG